MHRGIRRGDITAAPSDLTVLQARIAVDVMVRILEKKEYFKHVAPRVQVVDGSNIRTWDSSTTLALGYLWVPPPTDIIRFGQTPPVHYGQYRQPPCRPARSPGFYAKCLVWGSC